MVAPCWAVPILQLVQRHRLRGSAKGTFLPFEREIAGCVEGAGWEVFVMSAPEQAPSGSRPGVCVDTGWPAACEQAV